MDQPASVDVAVIGGGVAGRTVGLFTARHGLDTTIIDAGSSLLRRNAHLENYPGFPGGVDARRLLDLMREQCEDAGCRWIEASVERLAQTKGGFEATTDDDRQIGATHAVAATKNAVDYLDAIDDLTVINRGSKAFVETDRRGHTGVERLYAAGRLAEVPHQTIACAGHGATVAITILEEANTPFYQDWVAPEGYFTGRGREVPPGCEEIGDAKRANREAAGRARLLEAFEDTPAEPPQQHPSVID